MLKKYFALIILIFLPYVADAAAQKVRKDSLASINGKIYDGSAEDLFKSIAKGYGRINVSLNTTCNFSPIVTKTQYFSENTVLSEWDGYQALAGSMLHTFENASRPAWSADFHYLGGIGTDFFTHSLDSEVSWSFLKRSLTVSLKGIDLLNQGRSYTSNVTADASTQTWKPIYGRYFMLGIKYLFRRK